MKEIVIGNIGQNPSIHFNVLEDWESFDVIISILTKYFSAVITAKIDLPESKFYKLSIGDSNFTLINDPYGNSLRADNKQADEFIKVIFSQWSKYHSASND